MTGNSTAGYEVKGTADANATVEIRNAGGAVIGTGTADGTGAFTVTIPAGEAGANETLTAVAKTPAVQKVRQQRSKRQRILIRPWRPIVETVTGSTTKGYEVKGTAEVGTTIEVRDAAGTVLGTATTGTDGKYTVTLDSGTATANQTLSVVAKTLVARKVNQQRRQHQLMSLHQQLITSQATLVRVMKLQEQQTLTQQSKFVIHLGQSLVQVPLMRMVILL